MEMSLIHGVVLRSLKKKVQKCFPMAMYSSLVIVICKFYLPVEAQADAHDQTAVRMADKMHDFGKGLTSPHILPTQKIFMMLWA